MEERHQRALPDLVTDSLEEYEALALKLSVDRDLLQSHRRKLEDNRASCALFDTARLSRHVESAYQTMWDRHRRGEPPTISPWRRSPMRQAEEIETEASD